MRFEKTMTVSLSDIYQMLISECRYGYRRNNHLMPWGAYDKVRRIVPEMYKVDKEYAVHTLKQICEECISEELIGHFYDGVDDENGNMDQALVFINWCLDWIHEHETDARYTETNTLWEPMDYGVYKKRWNKFINIKED